MRQTGGKFVTGWIALLLLITVPDVIPLRVGANNEQLAQLVIGKLLVPFRYLLWLCCFGEWR